MATDMSAIKWIDIGVDGLEEFIPGLPQGDAILVRGEPGTGKTILCLQFLHKGAENGEKCVKKNLVVRQKSYFDTNI